MDYELENGYIVSVIDRYSDALPARKNDVALPLVFEFIKSFGLPSKGTRIGNNDYVFEVYAVGVNVESKGILVSVDCED